MKTLLAAESTAFGAAMDAAIGLSWTHNDAWFITTDKDSGFYWDTTHWRQAKARMPDSTGGFPGSFVPRDVSGIGVEGGDLGEIAGMDQAN